MMIPDFEHNMLIRPSEIPLHLQEESEEFFQAIWKSGIKVVPIDNCPEIWCRDFLPVQVSANKFVQFRYAPDYLEPETAANSRKTSESFSKMYGLNIQYSELLLEGGNSVAGTNFVIITEKVIRNNPHLKPAEIVSQLQQLLEVDKVILIPTEPGDVIGHADGMVQVLNSTTLLVNNYSSSNYSAHFRRKFYGALAELGMNMILMPYNPVIEMSSDGIPQAIGCYMNYIRIGNQVFLPQFNSMIDIEAAEVFQRYAPELTIHQLPAQAIARNGGVFHCMTWWMNAEQLEPKQYCPICAKEVSYNSRYPNYVCRSCSEMTKSPDGRSIQFYNSDILGDGVTGIYTGTDEVYHSTSCLIGGKLCKAEEARFGGIVIQVI